MNKDMIYKGGHDTTSALGHLWLACRDAGILEGGLGDLIDEAIAERNKMIDHMVKAKVLVKSGAGYTYTSD
jgi:hypothetical protein